jgi:hypothetical protein
MARENAPNTVRHLALPVSVALSSILFQLKNQNNIHGQNSGREPPKHYIRIKWVNLAAAWPQIERRLLDVIGEA